MQNLRRGAFLAAAVLLAAWPAVSQIGVRAPEFRGVFNPVVGSGAAYEMASKAGKSDLELTVVGKEDVNGKPGVWIEMAINPPQGSGPMYAKNLMVIDGKSATSAKMIVQITGQPPMDITSMIAAQQAPPASIDVRDSAEHVGTEDVTTPAGTFSCEHYKAKDGAWEAWLSDKVIPWGLVKSNNGADTTMVLTKVITGATDHITGTPVPMNLSGLGQRGGVPPQH
jgi:hypothetical protein